MNAILDKVLFSINKDISEIIHREYWKGIFTEQVLPLIDMIEYNTHKHISTMPRRPIALYHTVMYVPDTQILYRYVRSWELDGEREVRSIKDVNISSYCDACTIDTAPQIVSWEMPDQTYTVPIFRWKRICKRCIRAITGKNLVN